MLLDASKIESVSLNITQYFGLFFYELPRVIDRGLELKEIKGFSQTWQN